MRLAVLAVILLSVALAQRAPAEPSPPGDKPTGETPKGDKPKGRIIDPWGRIPRPRDGMRLPDPRKAAEKTVDGAPTPATSEPVPVEPTPPAAAPPEPDVTAEPAVATAPVPMPASTTATSAPLPPPSTPFRTTRMAFVKPPPPAPHEGLTLEAGTGIGWIALADDSNTVTSPGGVAGLSIGIGGWLGEKVALTARLAGSSVPSSQGLVVAAFLGPSLQIWISEHTWFGAGIGLATLGIDAERPENERSLGGVAGDVRLGHTFYETGKHTLNASIEVTPGSVSENRPYGPDLAVGVMSVGILFGWQYL
jgi:hypothetical protein